MPKNFTEGEAVRVSDREQVSGDIKSQLFYPHYRGLNGTVGKIFADGTAAVNVDSESLPADVRARHTSGTQAMRQKWLDGMSDEARNRLSASEKRFSLTYTILVSQTDLVERSADAQIPSADPPSELPRKSLADIEAEEARHLDEISKKAKG